MSNCKIILASLTAGLLVAFSGGAQTTNLPPTAIENFETQTDTVIVKGFSLVGTMSIGDATLAVIAKATSDIGPDQKVYGIRLVLSGSQPGGFSSRRALVVDYDELDSLANAIEYLQKITYDVTPLDGFDSGYTTKSGLCISAHSERRQGAIQTFIQFGDAKKIPLTSDQMSQLRNLVLQSKKTLDAIK
jgi:hypothetical protein